jgi:hypothetical protein
MHTHSLTFYSTPNGTQLARTKMYGENCVPFGCHYDEGDVTKSFTIRLEEDIFPLLKILSATIFERFGIEENDLKMTAWIGGEPEIFTSIDEFQQACFENLFRHPPEGFEALINLDFAKAHVPFGTQIIVLLDKETWNDLEAYEEYPVWSVSFAGISQDIDSAFSLEQLENIINIVMERLAASSLLSRNKDRNA